jgi:hypothetical protein
MLSHEDHAMMTTFEIVAPGAGDRAVRRNRSDARAVVAGEQVAVPLDTLTPDEARRTRTLLAAQAARPGQPAPVPSAPLLIADDAAMGYLCRL